jgi:hypothetical protein
MLVEELIFTDGLGRFQLGGDHVYHVCHMVSPPHVPTQATSFKRSTSETKRFLRCDNGAPTTDVI